MEYRAVGKVCVIQMGVFLGIAYTYFAAHLRVRQTGWRIKHITDREVRHLFEFLNPILHPERPGQISLTMAITIVASFEGRVLIDWAMVLHDLIQKHVALLERIPLFSYACPFLFHVYAHSGCLSASENIYWTDACRPYQPLPRAEPVQPTLPRSDHELVEALVIVLDCDREELIQVAKKLKKGENHGFQGGSPEFNSRDEERGNNSNAHSQL